MLILRFMCYQRGRHQDKQTGCFETPRLCTPWYLCNCKTPCDTIGHLLPSRCLCSAMHGSVHLVLAATFCTRTTATDMAMCCRCVLCRNQASVINGSVTKSSSVHTQFRLPVVNKQDGEELLQWVAICIPDNGMVDAQRQAVTTQSTVAHHRPCVM